MPRYIVKVNPDEDLYVEWSTVVDGPIVWGTRDEITEYLIDSSEKKREYATPEVADRMRRADEYGSSALQGDFQWGDDFIMYQQKGWMPRKRLLAFLYSYDETTQSFNEGLLEPFEDDDER